MSRRAERASERAAATRHFYFLPTAFGSVRPQWVNSSFQVALASPNIDFTLAGLITSLCEVSFRAIVAACLAASKMPPKRVYSGHKGSRDNTSRVGDKPRKRLPPTPQRFEGDSAKVSASAKKLRMSTDDYQVNMDPTFGYRLIEFVSVFTAIAQLVVCKKCGSDVKFQVVVVITST